MPSTQKFTSLLVLKLYFESFFKLKPFYFYQFWAQLFAEMQKFSFI